MEKKQTKHNLSLVANNVLAKDYPKCSLFSFAFHESLLEKGFVYILQRDAGSAVRAGALVNCVYWIKSLNLPRVSFMLR